VDSHFERSPAATTHDALCTRHSDSSISVGSLNESVGGANENLLAGAFAQSRHHVHTNSRSPLRAITGHPILGALRLLGVGRPHLVAEDHPDALHTHRRQLLGQADHERQRLTVGRRNRHEIAPEVYR
jgi:hypothetical protein